MPSPTFHFSVCSPSFCKIALEFPSTLLLREVRVYTGAQTVLSEVKSCSSTVVTCLVIHPFRVSPPHSRTDVPATPEISS